MSYTTAAALNARAREVLEIIIVRKDIKNMPAILTPDLRVVHDDDEPLIGPDALISQWERVLKFAPGLTYAIKDIIAEVDGKNGGGKAWAFSRVTGLPGGKSKDSVDMMEINAEGKLVSMKDVQRELE